MNPRHRKTVTEHAEDMPENCETGLRAIIQRTPIPQFIIGNDHRIIYWNNALEKYSGISAGEVVGTTQQWRAFYPDERPCLADLLADEKEELIPEWYPNKYAKSKLIDGAYEVTDFFPKIGEAGVWLYFTAAAIRDNKGKVIGAVETLEDVTERKKAEDALRKSEEKFRNVFDWANDAILLHKLTNKHSPGQFIEVNQVACEMLGYSREELLRMGPPDIVPAELHPQLKEIIRDAQTEKKFLFETKLRRKDGSTFPVESSAHLVEYDSEKMWISHIRDISERNQAEKALRESEEKFRQLVENISDIIFTMDLEGRITYISPVIEKIYGYRPEEVTGRQYAGFIHSDDLPAVTKEFQRRIRGEYGENVFRIIAKDGSTHYVRTTESPIIQNGNVTGFNYVMTDFTKRRKAEDSLREINKKLNMLSQITRHDILNQIMAIRCNLELSKTIAKEPKLIEYIDLESESVDLIQRQIEFTRSYQDIGMNEPEWQDVDKIIGEVVQSFGLKGITFENSVRGVEVYADPLIEKVFYNLLENSLRHGEHVSRISFSSSETKEGFVISYRDDGVGITEEDKKKLFKKGFGKHTGLGLFLSKEILSITGITIQETGEPGKGVNFEIIVPKEDYRFQD